MNLSKKIYCLVLCFVLIVSSCFVFPPVIAEQDVPKYGTVNVSDWLYVRSSASASAAEKGKLYPGDKVKILEKVNTKDTANPVWYKIQFLSDSKLEGYVSAKYIKEDVVYVPEDDFEDYLTKQGFPESYKPMLRELHANYPNWVFVADHLNYTWDKALSNESKVGTSLIENSQSDALKSMEYGAYNWENKSYVNFEKGGYWVTAHKSVVAYYLDPRNSLNSTAIFQFLNQTYDPTKQNKEGLTKLVSGTFLANEFPEDTYKTYCDVLMEAAKAKQSGVSPYILASMIINEQGAQGTGNSISGNVSGYNGYYNFYNIGASPDGPHDDSVKNGLYWAKSKSNNGYDMRPWNTRAKAIIGGAIWYGKKYVNDGQPTLYYKRFDYFSSDSYITRYYTDITASYREGSKLRSAYEAAINTEFVFNIPVYKNMPSEISPEPSKTGNNDYYLKSLSVGEYSYNPTFSKYVYEYSMIVDYNVSTVTIGAQKSNNDATVKGLGQVALVVGINRFNIEVTSTSGRKQTYKVVITRKDNDGNIPVGPTIETTEYNVGEYITGVDLNTAVSDFKTKIKVKNGTVKIFNAAGKEKTSGIMETGNVVKIYDSKGMEKLSYKIVIYGDVNGDGKINSIDISRIQKHILKLSTLSDCYLKASDVSRDTKSNSIDISRIQKHILKLSTIEQ